MTDLDELVLALEDGGKSDGRGLRLTSYSSKFSAKKARTDIITKLKELRARYEFDHYPTA